MFWNTKSKINYFVLSLVFLPSWVLLKAEKHLEEAGNENHNWLTIQNIILLGCFIKYWHAKVVLLFWNHWTPKHKTQRKKNINSKGKDTDDSILTYTINPQGILLFISILKLQKKQKSFIVDHRHVQSSFVF